MKYTISPPLLRVLYQRLNINAHNVQIPPASTDWMSELSTLLHAKGFHTKVWSTTLSTIAPQITDGLPALGVTPTGEWILLENHSWNWVQHYNLSHNKGGWRSVRSLDQYLHHQTIHWLLIEPIQPKSILSSEQIHLNPLQRLLRLIHLERLDMGMIVGLGILIGICALATPLTIQILINWVAFGGLTQPIVSLCLVLFAILCLHTGLALFQRIIVERFERRLFIRTVEDLSRRFHQVRIEALDNVNVSDLANRFFDILTVRKSMSTLMIEGFGSVLQIIVATGILALYHPWFLMVDTLLIGGMIGVFRFHARKGTKTAIVESKSKYKVASWIETIGHHSSAFRVGEHEIAPLESERLTSLWLKHREKHFRIFIQQYGSAHIFQIGMSILLLLLGGQLVLEGELSIGQFVAAEFVVTNALIGFTKFIDKMDTIYDLLASLDKLGSVLDLEVETVSGMPKDKRKPIEITLDNVHLPNTSMVLNGTFSANRTHIVQVPEFIGLKQVAELLCGIRHCHTGTVYHDGTDVEHIGIADRYSGIDLLSRGQLFEGTIFDNVAMGDSHIQAQDIWQTLDKIGLADWFRKHTSTLDKVVPNDTPLLTTGILLARCLLSRSNTIILYSFFDGVPNTWKHRWLRLLSQDERTIIVLESADIHHWKPLLSALPTGIFGGLHDHFT